MFSRKMLMSLTFVAKLHLICLVLGDRIVEIIAITTFEQLGLTRSSQRADVKARVCNISIRLVN